MGKSLIQIFPAYLVIVNQTDGGEHSRSLFRIVLPGKGYDGARLKKARG
jgi:hypothetical protein